jgi:hypothetical protein
VDYVVGRHPIVWDDNLEQPKLNKNKVHVGLDGRESTTVHTTTNQKEAAVTD